MDLGLFISRKRRAALLIVGPLLFLGLSYGSFSLYLKSQLQRLRERKVFIESMPTINRKISMAQELVESFRSNLSDPEVIELLNSQLSTMATRNGFSIDSLTVKPQESKGANKALSVFDISIRGAGTLDSIIRFFSEAEKLRPLLILNNVDLRTTAEVYKRIYSTQILFSYTNFS